MQPQSAETPITSLSDSYSDIVAAAEERAAFWGYAPDARYTVAVRLPGKPPRDVEVTHEVGEQFSIRR